ncbi:MAG: hypothetical protein OXB92_17270, partial [Acidimicrobiaceae bacterium]|nr:hypothetical protein [Acidimicrobiaceae bacterium]
SNANEAAGDITGLVTAASVVEKEITQANKILGPGTLSEFAELVDGVHAMSFADLRTVTAIGAWQLWSSTIINSAAENQTLAAFLREAGLRWSSRGGIEAATAADDWAAFVGRAQGLDGAGVMPVWASGRLTRDRYTGAKKGEIELTISYFWNLGFPRPSSFARVKFVA